MCVTVSHVGVAPEQSALTMHATHVAVAGLHTGVAPVHWLEFDVEQTPQTPLGWHAGVFPAQSTSPAQPRHTCVIVLHTGVAPLQVALVTHATHAPAVVSHEGVPPLHFAVFVAEHAPHAPPGWQAGVAPPHSPSTAQPRHACVIVLHTGVAPLQSALATQPTQAPVETLHTAFVPVHFAVLVAEQAPHAPPGWQAGVAPPHSPSTAQPRHVCVVRLHTGAAPPQSPLARQPTQIDDTVKH